MRWVPFLILAYVALGLQVGIGDHLDLAGGSPNLVLLTVVFACMNATRDSALLAAFLLGLSHDLFGANPIGLLALAYGLAGVTVISARRVAGSDHPVTNVLLTLLAGLVTAVVVTLRGWIHPAGDPPFVHGHEVGFKAALYTAAVAPVVLWTLNKLRPLMGMRTGRSRY